MSPDTTITMARNLLTLAAKYHGMAATFREAAAALNHTEMPKPPTKPNGSNGVHYTPAEASILAAMNGNAVTTKQIHSQTGLPGGTIASGFYHLARKGAVRRTGHGIYELVGTDNVDPGEPLT